MNEELKLLQRHIIVNQFTLSHADSIITDTMAALNSKRMEMFATFFVLSKMTSL